LRAAAFTALETDLADLADQTDSEGFRNHTAIRFRHILILGLKPELRSALSFEAGFPGLTPKQ
jgi:hypothetical protein